MSHVATIDLEIKDLAALQAAAKELGLEYIADQTSYRWYGRHVGDYPCPEGFKPNELGKAECGVFRMTDNRLLELGYTRAQAYEIGVCKRRDGKPGFTLLWDFYANGFGLQNCIGENGVELRKGYAKIVATKKAKAAGFTVTQKVLADGSIQLTCSK